MPRHENRIKTSDDQTPRFWVDGGDEYDKLYMDGPKLLQYLQDNDPEECGCDWMTDKEFTEMVEEAT